MAVADDSDHPPGAHQDGTREYSSQIATFKKNNRQILNTFPIPPDFATFWRQAAQQGYTQQLFRPRWWSCGSVGASRPRAGHDPL
jgi:ABC-type branched-subunit amino acid transport system substrate-binding protein